MNKIKQLAKVFYKCNSDYRMWRIHTGFSNIKGRIVVIAKAGLVDSFSIKV